MGRWPGRGHRWDAAWPSGEVTSADSSPFLSSYVVARVPFHQLLKDLSGTRLNKTPSSFSGRRRQSVFLIFKHQLLVIVGPHWFLPSML